MKIGIITLWNTQDNYGGVLQNYALQTFLKTQGHEPFLVRFKHSSMLLTVKKMIKKLFFKGCNHSFPKEYSLRSFDDFRQSYTHLSTKIYNSAKQLNKDLPTAPLYITGSDQVWNFNTLDGSGNPYFLDFGKSCKIHRISYAASFGSIHASPKFLQYIKPKLEKFDSISVREEDGVEICRKVGLQSFNISVVCDPTLLLSQSSYSLISENAKYPLENYVFVYFLGWKTLIPQNEIIAFASQTDSAIHYTPSQGMDPNFLEVKPEYLKIPEWLSYIKHAKYFITNSFHGVVFAILNHISFIVIPVSGSKQRMNSRIETLLKKLELENRIYRTKNDILNKMQKLIDWNKIDCIIAQWRKESAEWLMNSINSIK